jgi:hypothetical protein
MAYGCQKDGKMTAKIHELPPKPGDTGDTGFRCIGTQDVYSGGYRIPSGSLMLGAIRTTLDKF